MSAVPDEIDIRLAGGYPRSQLDRLLRQLEPVLSLHEPGGDQLAGSPRSLEGERPLEVAHAEGKNVDLRLDQPS